MLLQSTEKQHRHYDFHTLDIMVLIEYPYSKPCTTKCTLFAQSTGYDDEEHDKAATY